MKTLLLVALSLGLVAPCFAEPGQVNLKPMRAALRSDVAPRDGAWLLEACEQHEAWGRKPDGTLWRGRDSNEENLGAGLCAGFVSGVLGAPGDTGRVLRYLRANTARLGEPAARLVLDAMLEK